jgi:chromosome condensin MukBEF complex kleisin-like MukF subunit
MSEVSYEISPDLMDLIAGQDCEEFSEEDLRDDFAMHIASGLASQSWGESAEKIAMRAYEIADQMMKYRVVNNDGTENS